MLHKFFYLFPIVILGRLPDIVNLKPTSSASGWWVLIKPLSAGNHQLSFGGSVVDNPTTGTQSFATEATYNLNVK
jgi:hypothetical protein